MVRRRNRLQRHHALTQPGRHGPEPPIGGTALRLLQYGPIGEQDPGQTPRGCARFSLTYVDCDYVPRLQAGFFPATNPKRLGGGRLGGPIDDLAVVILHVEKNKRVRIGPGKSRHRYVLEFSRHIVHGRTSMMCGQRRANQQNAPEQESRYSPRSHMWLLSECLLGGYYAIAARDATRLSTLALLP